MLISLVKVAQNNPSHGPLEGLDSVDVIVRAMRTDERPIIVVHPAKSARTQLLDRLIPALRQESVRVIRATSLDGGKIELVSMMDQVVGEACADAVERSERCYNELTTARANEKRITLIVDEAHLVTHQTLRYLELVSLLDKCLHVPLQIMLIGDRDILGMLPPSGGLSVDRGAHLLVLADGPATVDTGADRAKKGPFIQAVPKLAAQPIVSARAATAAPGPGARLASAPLAPLKTPASNEALAGQAPPPAADTPPAGKPPVIEASPAIAEAVAPATVPLSTGAASVQAEPAADPAGPRQGRRGRAAMAACIGALVVGTGLAIDRFGDDTLALPGFMRAPGADRVADPPGRSNPMRSPGLMAHETPVVALSPPAAPQAFQPNVVPEAPKPAGPPARLVQRALAAVPSPAAQTEASGDAASPLGVSEKDAKRATPPPPTTGVPAAPDGNRPDAAAPVAAQQPAAASVTPDTAAPVAAQQPAAVSASATSTSAAADVSVTAAPDAHPTVRASLRPAEVPAAAAPQATPVAPTLARPASAAVTDTADRINDAAPVVATAPIAMPERGPDVQGSAQAVPVAASVGQSSKIDEIRVSRPTPASDNVTVPTSLVAASVPPALAGAPAALSISPDVVAILILRGDGLLALGDVSAARLMYQRAAMSGSARGAFALGKTYDPTFLTWIGAQGIAAEPQRALDWYRRAAKLGSVEATQRLAQLDSGNAR